MAWVFGGGSPAPSIRSTTTCCIGTHARDLCAQLARRATRAQALCDEYFRLRIATKPRRGRLFFETGHDFDSDFAYMRAVGDGFLDAYLPIVERRRETAYGERERQFQLYRRGRYVEFNLVLDRGTLFGLQSGGRTESILMSLPPLVRWEYGFQPEPGSPEARLADYLQPRDWLGELASALP